MTKQDLLDQIRADILKDNICSDLAQNAKNLVFGDGNIDARIVFIGEAPGKKEDELGLPFVGAAGKYLDELLASISLTREEVYITNIVKYRPPNNRDPEPAEKIAFWPYLVRQINAIKPSLVVTLGRHPMSGFLPNQKISQIHGQPKRIKWDYNTDSKLAGGKSKDAKQGAGENRTEQYEMYNEGESQPATQQRALSGSRVLSSAHKQADTTLVILPLYHPAAALYNGGMRETLAQDFKNINKTLNLISKGNSL